MITKLCPPSLLYLGFSVTQIIIDLFSGLFNIALAKFLVMIVFTFILNFLCNRGLSIISWIVVFIPFVFMTLITSVILVAFTTDTIDNVII